MDSRTVIAVVEDDTEIGPLVVNLLKREGFDAEICPSGEALDRLRARRRIDLVVLDLMLPGEDGLSICRRLQTEGEIPVLMVTARGDDIDRIIGLEIGADDYLAKPFNPRELVARARAILRRTRDRHRIALAPAGERWAIGGFQIDSATRIVVTPDLAELDLTGGEFDLLLAFVRHPRRVLTRDQLIDWTRGRDAQPFDRSIDVLVGKLRRKLASHPAGEGLIKTIRGGGYCLASPVERN